MERTEEELEDGNGTLRREENGTQRENENKDSEKEETRL